MRRVVGHALWRAKALPPLSVHALAGARSRLPDRGVALTFDDGPHPEYTVGILDVLADLEVPATFFCVGKNAERFPGITRRALAEGHAVGSHSMTHPHPGRVPHAVIRREYVAGRQAVEAITDRPTRLFRPPHGYVGLTHAALLRRRGFQPWLWTIDPEDWRPGVTVDSVVRVATQAQSGDIILLHDWVEEPWAPEALDRSATVEAVRPIVDALRRRGLRFTTLPS
jgi:peptidoglycan/xylan/chitin deacetylase (PgdA/CDA1 family)